MCEPLGFLLLPRKTLLGGAYSMLEWYTCPFWPIYKCIYQVLLNIELLGIHQGEISKLNAF